MLRRKLDNLTRLLNDKKSEVLAYKQQMEENERYYKVNHFCKIIDYYSQFVSKGLTHIEVKFLKNGCFSRLA